MPTVRSRTVFYLGGFDPQGAAHYHRLYQDEAAKQAGLAGGIPIEVGPRQRLQGGDACWELEADTASGKVATRYHFMHWDDIVRAHWPRRDNELWWEVIRTTLFNLRHGALWRMLQSCWPPVLALFAPFALLMAVLVGVPLLLVGTFWLLAVAGWGPVASGLAGIALVAGLAWLARRLEARFSMAWLMRSYAFNRRQALGLTPELEERLDAQAAMLAQRVQQAQDDEVLLVGHSSGAIMAVSVLARALKLDPQLARRGPAVSLLTLGHCIPMLGCLPQAQTFRRELSELGRAEGIAWLDFTAPPDGSCFALVDPLVACGIDRNGALPDRPKLLSPRFMAMFEPARYASLRPDKFRIHFQYLMASEKPVAYDYFAITAGDQTLAGRFAAEPSVRDFAGLRLFARRSGPAAVT